MGQRRRQGTGSGATGTSISLSNGAQFIQRLELTRLEMESLVDRVRKYAKTWFRLDQRYLQVHPPCTAVRPGLAASDAEPAGREPVPNNYLSRLNVRWQQFVDACQRWEAAPWWPAPVLRALRAPVPRAQHQDLRADLGCLPLRGGEELQSLIRREDRFEAELVPAAGLFAELRPVRHGRPATTQDSGAGRENGSGGAGGWRERHQFGQPCEGPRAGGERVRRGAGQGRAGNGQDDSRALVRDHDVVYVYHNLIDKTGDTRDTQRNASSTPRKTRWTNCCA